ncbi:hypothetical protein BT69DRAFT_714099 [Atractiella rhizophila]|nr:hypothetical protein BT69DRAFT_714099 [Atractiella rhizophila]
MSKQVRYLSHATLIPYEKDFIAPGGGRGGAGGGPRKKEKDSKSKRRASNGSDWRHHHHPHDRLPNHQQSTLPPLPASRPSTARSSQPSLLKEIEGEIVGKASLAQPQGEDKAGAGSDENDGSEKENVPRPETSSGSVSGAATPDAASSNAGHGAQEASSTFLRRQRSNEILVPLLECCEDCLTGYALGWQPSHPIVFRPSRRMLIGAGGGEPVLIKVDEGVGEEARVRLSFESGAEGQVEEDVGGAEQGLGEPPEEERAFSSLNLAPMPKSHLMVGGGGKRDKRKSFLRP